MPWPMQPLVLPAMEKKHLNPFGGIHGGVYSSLIDTAAYWAVYCELDENIGLISLDLNVDNLAPVKEGKLIVKGRRIKIGRNVCLAEAMVTNEEGKPLAHGNFQANDNPRLANDRAGSNRNGR